MRTRNFASSGGKGIRGGLLLALAVQRAQTASVGHTIFLTIPRGPPLRLSNPFTLFDALFMTRLFVLVVMLFGLRASCAAAGELEERWTIKSNVVTLLLASDFAQLETIAEKYRSSKSRTSSGLWHLTLYYSGMREVWNAEFQDEKYWQGLEQSTLQWAQKYPNSPTPHVAHALVMIGHGWYIRGGGYANTVDPQAWEPFKRYIEQARIYLEQHKAQAARDPRWYEAMLEVAKIQSWSPDKFNKLVEEALDREPLFYQTYFAAIDFLTPKWHGSAEGIEAFANQAVKRTRAQEGLGLYARIYWYASQTYYSERLFTDSKVRWTKMRLGIGDVLGKYPDAWNLNNFARFACLAGDREQTRALLTRISANVIDPVWRKTPTLQDCQEWAGEVDPGKI